MADINVPGPVHFSENGMEGTFSWSASFSARIGSNFSQAQKYVDSEVLRYSDPMTPKKNGILIGSGKSGTVLGSGLVQYTAIYARWQYYRTAQTRPYDANRGGKWFERMKAAHKEDIMNGAKKILGGGSI